MMDRVKIIGAIIMLNCNILYTNANTVKDMDRSVANDELENDPYTDETQWILKKELYEKISENPGMLSEALISQFYLTNQSETFAQLSLVEDAKGELFAIDSLADTTISSQQYLIAQDMDAIAVQMNLLDTAVAYNDTAAVPVILSTIETLTENIEDNAEIADSVVTEQLAEQATEANVIVAANNSLSGNAVIEENELIVNDIYLRTIAKGIYVFTPEQIILFHDIAVQCPLSGGNAVFRARAMYALVDKTLHYDNFAICAQEGIALRKGNKKQTKEHNATLYPNPANDKATLLYTIAENETATFYILTTSGQEVLIQNLLSADGAFTFSTSHFKPGVYHYKLVSNGFGVENGKLVIVR